MFPIWEQYKQRGQPLEVETNFFRGLLRTLERFILSRFLKRYEICDVGYKISKGSETRRKRIKN
jgi:hypothetical protein